MPEDLFQNNTPETQPQSFDSGDVKKLMEQYGLTDEDLNSFFQEEFPSESEETTKTSQPPASGGLETQGEKKYAGIFNSVEELEKAYKELQAEYTRQRQRTKKFESFIDLLEQNPDYANYIVEKTQEFFFKKEKPQREIETNEFEDLFNEEAESVKKFAFNKEDILNLVRQEVNQALAAQRLIDDFRRKYPEVTDEELLKIINHARQFGGDLETSYMVLFKDRFKERILRQALEEMKKGISPQRMGARQETTPTKKELTEDDYFQLAREIIAGKRKLDELEPNERAKLLNIIARQLIVM